MARTTKIGALSIDLRAQSATLRKDMGQANRVLRSSSAQMNRSLAVLERGFGSAQARARGLAASLISIRGPLAALLGGGGLIALTRSALAAADEMAKAADRSGVAVEAFQELNHAAGLAGVGAQKLQTGLQRLNRTLGTAAGGGADPFRAMGVSILDASGEIRAADAVLEDVADRIAGARSEAERAAIAYQAFGRSGQDMLPMLRGGAAGIREMRDEAQRLGLVFSEETARGAARLNDELATLGRVLRVNLQQGLLRGLTDEAIGLRDAVASPGLIEGLRAIGGMIGGLGAMAAQAVAQLGALVKLLSGDFSGGTLGAFLEGTAPGIALRLFGVRLREVDDEARQAFDSLSALLGAGDDLGAPGGGATGSTPVDRLRQAIADTRFELELLRSGLDEISRDVARSVRGFGLVESLEDLTGAQEDVTAFAQAVRELRREQEALSRLQRDQARAQEIWRQTRTAAEEYGETLEELNRLLEQGSLDHETYARGLAQAQERMESLDRATNEAGETMRQFGRRAASAFEEAALRGAKLSDVVRSLAEDISRLLLRRHITAPLSDAIGGMLASFDFGGLLGFATGGSFRVGGGGGVDSQLVAFRATPGEMVDVRTPGQAAGGGVEVNLIVNNYGGSQVETQQRQRADGGLDLVVEVDRAVATNLSRPGSQTRRAMEAQFGAQQRLTKQ